MQQGQDLPVSSAFIIAPRAGVLLSASPRIGIWLRAGFTRVAETDKSQDNSGSTSFWDFNLEPQLLFVVAPRVTFALGAVLDAGFAGETRYADGNRSTQNDFRSGAYGLTAGLTALF